MNVLEENIADNDLASLVTSHLEFVPSTCDKAISVVDETAFALVLPYCAQPKGGKFKTNRELPPGVFRAWHQITCICFQFTLALVLFTPFVIDHHRRPRCSLSGERDFCGQKCTVRTGEPLGNYSYRSKAWN